MLPWDFCNMCCMWVNSYTFILKKCMIYDFIGVILMVDMASFPLIPNDEEMQVFNLRATSLCCHSELECQFLICSMHYFCIIWINQTYTKPEFSSFLTIHFPELSKMWRGVRTNNTIGRECEVSDKFWSCLLEVLVIDK